MLSLAWLTCPDSRNQACYLTKKRSQWGATKFWPVKIVVLCSSKMQAQMIWLFGEEMSVASSDLVITATYTSPLGWVSSPSSSSRSKALLQEAIWRSLHVRLVSPLPGLLHCKAKKSATRCACPSAIQLRLGEYHVATISGFSSVPKAVFTQLARITKMAS